MSEKTDFFNFQELRQHFGLSEQTLRREIKKAKSGQSSFPAPVFGHNRKGLWARSAVANWVESQSNGKPQT